MKIFIDGDGCPVIDLTVKIAKSYKLDVNIVKNYAHHIYSDYANIISVDIANDSADFYIVNHAKSQDIVVTQDYGLASLCLAKDMYCLNQDGKIFTNNNIDIYLNTRHIHGELRRQKKRHSNMPKRKEIQNVEFRKSLINIIETNIEYRA